VLLPPHPAIQLKRTSRLPRSSHRPVFWRFIEPRDANANPPNNKTGSGITAAYVAMLVVPPNGTVNAPKLVGALTLSVELAVLVPSITEAGDTVQAANGAGPLTIQLKFTCPENPFCPINVSASVVCPPVFRVRVEDAEAKVKSGAKANVAVTDCAEFMATVQVLGSLPVQAPLHAEKIEPVAGVAVNETVVPFA